MFSVLRRSARSQAEGAHKARGAIILAWLVLGGIAALCLIAVALHVMRPDIDPIQYTVSNYAHGPYGFLMTAAFFVFAISLLVLTSGLSQTIVSQRKTRAGIFLLAIACLGIIVAGIFPVDPNMVQFPRTIVGTIHFLASMIAFLCIACAIVVISLALKKDERWHAFQGLLLRLSFLVLTALFCVLFWYSSAGAGLASASFLPHI